MKSIKKLYNLDREPKVTKEVVSIDDRMRLLVNLILDEMIKDKNAGHLKKFTNT